MSVGGGYGSPPGQPYGMLASESDREACQAVLKQAFEDERLNQDEFEARVGKAVAARTQGELAQLTRDIPRAPAPVPRPGRRGRRGWVLAAGIAAAVVAGIAAVAVTSSGSQTAGQTDTSAGPQNQKANSGPGGCPVGTSATALPIANALADDPVYLDPGSSQVTAAQAGQLRAKIDQVNPGRIRVAVVTPTTVSQGGGERALANAIASCDADAAGTTLVTTNQSTYLVTSYANDHAATTAVEAALNIHPGLAAGLLDAVGRLAVVDQASK